MKTLHQPGKGKSWGKGKGRVRVRIGERLPLRVLTREGRLRADVSHLSHVCEPDLAPVERHCRVQGLAGLYGVKRDDCAGLFLVDTGLLRMAVFPA